MFFFKRVATQTAQCSETPAESRQELSVLDNSLTWCVWLASFARGWLLPSSGTDTLEYPGIRSSGERVDVAGKALLYSGVRCLFDGP